jgi:hypothetical protein
MPVRRGAPALSSRRGYGSGRRVGYPELAVGVSFPPGLWTVVVLALVIWGLAGMFTLAWRNRGTPQELS